MMNQSNNSCKSTGVKQLPRASKTSSHNRKGNSTTNSTKTGRANIEGKTSHGINTDINETKDKICDICAQNLPGTEREEIYAFGKCDHRVCYVCSARLRVLCEQVDCPICREKLDNVIFSSNGKQSYTKFNLKNCLYNAKYKIYYETKAIEETFNKLLQYECQECLKKDKKSRASKRKSNSRLQKEDPVGAKLCQHSTDTNNSGRNGKGSSTASIEDAIDSAPLKAEKKSEDSVDSSSISERIEEDSQGLLKITDVTRTVLPDVFALKNHLLYIHKLKLCELCLTHNKLFPFEYSYYDNKSLIDHSKPGEPNTKHEGHPICKLCRGVFFNYDELIQHMSRAHYHCYLCGRHDYNMLIYFLDYSSLRAHFKTRHFLCELGQCRFEELTSAFDSVLEYELHLLQVHSSSTRGQQRTITLNSESHQARETASARTLRQDLPSTAALVPIGNVATANNPRQTRSETLQNQLRQQRLPSRAEFPALGQNLTDIRTNNLIPTTNPPLSVNNFPSLSQASTSSTTGSSNLSQRMALEASSSRTSFVRTLGGGQRKAEQLNEQDFPPLPEQPKTKGKKKVKQLQQTSSITRNNDANMTLDQLINASLNLSTSNSKFNSKKGNSAKSSKNVKQKAIKIQIS